MMTGPRAFLTRIATLPLVAWRNVRHGRRRSVAAIIGMGFALTMVLLQLGFLNAVGITATNLYDLLNFDVILIAPDYDMLYDAGTIPRERLRQAESVASVVGASPLWAAFGMWRCPAYPIEAPEGSKEVPEESIWEQARGFLSGRYSPRQLRRRQLLLLGVDLDECPFTEPLRGPIEAHRDQLRLDARLLLNARSHPDFGWDLRDRFSDWELNASAVQVVGGFDLPRGFAADGAAIASEQTFLAHGLWPSPERVSLGLVRIRPGTLPETLERLRAILPPDVQVVSRAELLERERDYWVNQTSTGKIFWFGVLVSMIVATVVVYQVLSNDVRNRLPEYATLKAIGYSEAAPAIIVMLQSLIFAVVSYLPAVALAFGLYWLTEALVDIPMVLTWATLGRTLLLSLAVGLFTSLLTVNRLRAANPADLF
jgi:putative ABC transport system permease protein